METPMQPPLFPEITPPQQQVVAFDPSKIRPLGAGAEQDELNRRHEIAEQRGDDLAAEQGHPEPSEYATASSNPPRFSRPPRPGRRRARGGYGPDYSDDPRLETPGLYALQEDNRTPEEIQKAREAGARLLFLEIAKNDMRFASGEAPNDISRQLAITRARQERRARGRL